MTLPESSPSWQLIRVGDQCRSLQETGQRGIRRVLLEFGGHGLQLGKIVHTRSILRILGTLQFLQKTAFVQYFGHHFGWFRIMFLGEIGQLVHQIAGMRPTVWWYGLSCLQSGPYVQWIRRT